MPWLPTGCGSPRGGTGLVHHPDRGSQYVSIKYTERLAVAGIETSVGSVGDSYDNALAETINGYKAELIHRRSWRSFKEVMGPIDNIPADGSRATLQCLAGASSAGGIT